MADLKLLAAQRKAARFEAAGMKPQAKKARKRLEELESAPAAPSMSNTKDELLAAAELAGIQADDSMTKAEILEALNE